MVFVESDFTIEKWDNFPSLLCVSWQFPQLFDETEVGLALFCVAAKIVARR